MGEKRLSPDGAMAAARRYVRRQPADDELAEGGTAAVPRGGILSAPVGNAGMTQLLGGGHLDTTGPVAPNLLALQRQLGNHAVVTLLRSPGPPLTGPPTASS